MHQLERRRRIYKVSKAKSMLYSLRILVDPNYAIPFQIQFQHIVDCDGEPLGDTEHVAVVAEMLLADENSAEEADSADVAAAVVLVDGLRERQLEELADHFGGGSLALIFEHWLVYIDFVDIYSLRSYIGWISRLQEQVGNTDLFQQDFLQGMSRKERQKSLATSIQLTTQIKAIERQIEDMETKHLERTWRDGNVLIGWGLVQQREPEGVGNISMCPKDRMFSLSSMTSRVQMELEESAFRQVNAMEGRLAANKKKYKKKKKKLRTLLT